MVIRIKNLTCLPLALPTVLGSAVHNSKFSRNYVGNYDI